jgi:adenosine kinase
VPLDRGIRLGIISPDGRDGMLQHAAQFFEAGIPFIFDPGQGCRCSTATSCCEFLRLATYCTVNDYEAQIVQERTGRRRGAGGAGEGAGRHAGRPGFAHLHRGPASSTFPVPVKPEAEVDPTGCGDAYRAGLLHGINHGLDWAQTGRLASLMGAIKIAHRGGQNHSPTRDEIGARYRASFGSSIW